MLRCSAGRGAIPCNGASHECDGGTPCKRLAAMRGTGAGIAGLTYSATMAYANSITRQVAAAPKRNRVEWELMRELFPQAAHAMDGLLEAILNAAV